MTKCKYATTKAPLLEERGWGEAVHKGCPVA